MEGYAVFLHHPDALPWQELAPIIALHPRYTMLDGRSMARRGVSRLLFKGCPRPVAKAVVAELNARGCEALVVADSDLVPNPAAEHVRNADCTGDGLRVHELFGGHMTVPWEKIILLTAGLICSPRERKVSRGGLAPKPIPATPPPDREGRILCLDVYSLTHRPHKRINRRHFNYDYLGPRLLPNSLENFVSLVADLRKFCSRARVSPAVEAISGRRWRELPLFFNEYDFDQDNLWFLQTLRAV